jgi:hypothetical protein
MLKTEGAGEGQARESLPVSVGRGLDLWRLKLPDTDLKSNMILQLFTAVTILV